MALHRWMIGTLIATAPILPAAGQRQSVDPGFRPIVVNPAYAGSSGPVVAIDEAHNNFHTMRGEYQPFAALLTLDGYHVTSLTTSIDAKSLERVDILVIANPRAEPLVSSAFSNAECSTLRTWVEHGGSLLLIADHPPYGWAAQELAGVFGIKLGMGWAYEPSGATITTQIVYTRANGGLGNHPILAGRDSSERINVVRAFTGESLTGPSDADVLLRLSPQAREAPLPADLDAAAEAAEAGLAPPASTGPVGGHSQGVALQVGKGRLVVLGEAGMFSAQAVTFPDSPERDFKVGMNVPGNDDKQLALNVLHWLSGLLAD
jgi:hypothetical protein